MELRKPTCCQYVPSYTKYTHDPAFHDEAADVDGAVVPYLLMDFAVVVPTFSVGLATPLAFVNLTIAWQPDANEDNVPLTMVASFAAVAAAVEQVQYTTSGEVIKPELFVSSLVLVGTVMFAVTSVDALAVNVFTFVPFFCIVSVALLTVGIVGLSIRSS